MTIHETYVLSIKMKYINNKKNTDDNKTTVMGVIMVMKTIVK